MPNTRTVTAPRSGTTTPSRYPRQPLLTRTDTAADEVGATAELLAANDGVAMEEPPPPRRGTLSHRAEAEHDAGNDPRPPRPLSPRFGMLIAGRQRETDPPVRQCKSSRPVHNVAENPARVKHPSCANVWLSAISGGVLSSPYGGSVRVGRALPTGATQRGARGRGATSPSIQVDGVDLFVDPGSAVGWSCRRYARRTGTPTLDQLREVLADA